MKINFIHIRKKKHTKIIKDMYNGDKKQYCQFLWGT